MKNIKFYKNEIDYIKKLIIEYENYILNDTHKRYRDYKSFLKYKRIILSKL